MSSATASLSKSTGEACSSSGLFHTICPAGVHSSAAYCLVLLQLRVVVCEYRWTRSNLSHPGCICCTANESRSSGVEEYRVEICGEGVIFKSVNAC
eukprot:670160-Rhodomonas_salina.1